MMNSIRSILSPLLLISYVCGSRIIEFPSGYTRPWFSLLYILILWTVYFFLVMYTILPHMIPYYSRIYCICFTLNTFTTLLSIVFGIYHNEKFKKCLKKLDVVENTLKQLGTTTNYQKQFSRIIWCILGWFIIIILMNYGEALWLRNEFDYDIIMAIFVPSVSNYCVHISLIDDLIITNVLGYIGLKFDEINEYLRKLARDNRPEIKLAGKNPILQSRQCGPSKIRSSKYMTWIVIHLHLELCKISRDINTTFGMQMTLKMAIYFCYIAASLREVFGYILIPNYQNTHKKTELLLLLSFWMILHIFKLLLLNYTCERISVKANSIRNFINKILYSTFDVEVRENILQLILQITQAPLRFYGIRLFQFGFSYLYKFCKSLTTVSVILIQAHNKK